MKEITQQRAWELIGNDEESWRDYWTTPRFEYSEYENNGYTITVRCELLTNAITYYAVNLKDMAEENFRGECGGWANY